MQNEDREWLLSMAREGGEVALHAPVRFLGLSAAGRKQFAADGHVVVTVAGEVVAVGHDSTEAVRAAAAVLPHLPEVR